MNELDFDLQLDPFVHFQNEFQKASKVVTKDANAMALATVSSAGVPSLRTVLFKGIVRGGFSFYTNYQSQKSKDLEANNRAALLFFWPAMDAQIRIEGEVFKLTAQESADYFRSRPRLSQIGAWASAQSEQIPSRQFLEKKVAEIEQRFQGKDVPCPPNWGGWHLIPLRFEFWFGHQGRLHDRYLFKRGDSASRWQTCRLSP